MLKQLIRVQIIVIVILTVLYGAAYWSITIDQQNTYDSVLKQQKPPEGKKYLEYCSGGVSSVLIDAKDSSCSADNPGDFAKFALALYAIIAALLFPFAFYIFIKVRTKLRR